MCLALNGDVNQQTFAQGNCVITCHGKITNLPMLPIYQSPKCVSWLIFTLGHPPGHFHRDIFLGAPEGTSKLKRPLLTISSSHQTYVRGMKKCLNGDVMEEVSPVLIKSLMTHNDTWILKRINGFISWKQMTGNHGFYNQTWGFPMRIPFNQC